MADFVRLAPPAAGRAKARRWTPGVTEDAAGLHFVEIFGHKYRWVPSWGWMVWQETHWVRDARLRHYADIRALCRAIGLDPSCGPQDSRRLAMSKTVSGVAKLARSDERIVMLPSEFDADPAVLNTPDGVVNLRDASIRPHAGDYVTKCATVAPAFGVRPVVWLQFLHTLFDSAPDSVAFMRRFLGYALTGETREQVVAFFHGEGANGKSTLLDVLLAIVGSYALKIPSSTLMSRRGDRHPTEVAQLCGIRLAVANEISEGEYWDEARIKEYSGDLKLTARFMRQDFFQFDATHKFVIAANHRPQLRTVDHAIRRRLLLVPFNVRFEGARRDPNMLAKLSAESPAILAWLVEGAAEWYRDGLGVPESVRAASEEYVDAMDSLGLWLGECCALTGSRDDVAPAGVLYRSYSLWKERRGESPLSQMRWGEQMASRVERHRSDGIKYRGIRLTPEERVRVDAATALRK